MPLKKYNTLSVLIENTLPITTIMNNSTNNNSNQDFSNKSFINKSSSSPSSNSSSNSPNTSTKIHQQKQQISQSPTSIANQMSLLNEMLPNIIESATAVSGSITATINSNTNESCNYSTFCSINNISASNQLPIELKTKLYNIFNQIEKEFDMLYAQNVKLQQQLSQQNTSIITNTSSTSTLVPSNTNNAPNHKSNKSSNDIKSVISSASSNDSSPKSTVVNCNNNKNDLIRPPLNINFQPGSNTTQSLTSQAKSALLSSKSRINNLSFPKFKPNAKEFIMQSIKNTSAQIVQKAQNHNLFNSKLQCSLAGHKDGIWDINCVSIPSNLLINSTNSNMNNNFSNNHNLLIGTASADTTARLWYFNSHVSYNNNNINNNASSGGAMSSAPSLHQSSLTCFNNNSQTISTSFCIQEYCGHSGSVNSIRFHPRFFTDSTNLILTASGDCQAHIWQCVLSPDCDSLESTSQVVLNYSNCYSYAMSNNNQNSPTSSNNYSNDLISNPAIIRSPIKRYEGHSDACIAAEWFPDGELLATASWDRMANVYNVETGKILCNLQHDDYLTNVSIHRMNKIILTSSKDTTFKVWDFRDPICTVNVYQGHNRSVNSAIFVNDDKIATASDDQTVKLWDLRIMRSPVCTINVNSGVNRICSINLNESLNTSETYLALPLDNRDIKLYNLNGERVLRMTRNDRVGHRRLVTSLASYNNLLFSSSFDKMVNCWSIDLNPSKSLSSSNSNNNTNKITINNKENNSINESQMNDKSLDNSNSWHSSLFRSTSPQPSVNNHTIATSLTSPLIMNSNANCQQPLNAISQNNTKGINSLSKLAERIKI